MSPQKKTISQQRAVQAERAPEVKLVKPRSEAACAARAIHKGQAVECERTLMHDGEHQSGTLAWRRRSGDER